MIVATLTICGRRLDLYAHAAIRLDAKHETLRRGDPGQEN